MIFCNSGQTSEIVTLGQAGSTIILATQLSFVIFALREEFAFLFQTFSRNDPPGKAPPSRGRSVFNKKKKKFNPVLLREAAPAPPRRCRTSTASCSCRASARSDALWHGCERSIKIKLKIKKPTLVF